MSLSEQIATEITWYLTNDMATLEPQEIEIFLKNHIIYTNSIYYINVTLIAFSMTFPKCFQDVLSMECTLNSCFITFFIQINENDA